jgi:oligopeptidase B
VTGEREPPAADRRPTVLRAHGKDRIDDWYWLRERDNPEVLEILEAENAFTGSSTAHLAGLEAELAESMLARVQLSGVGLPAAKGEWAYYTRTVEGLEYPLHCRRPANSPPPVVTGEDPDEVVMLDENELAEGRPYYEIGELAVSPDQRLLARATDFSGSELMVVEVRDLSTGEDLADRIEGAFSALGFAADNKTLFYTRPDAAMRPFQVWRHRLGTDPATDTLVFEETDERYWVSVDLTKDEEYLVIASESAVTSERHLIPADRPEADPVLVAPRRQGILYSLEHHHGELILLCNDLSENFTLYRAPAATPGRDHWTVLLAGRDDVRLESLDVLEGWVVVEERGHATTALRLLPLADQGSGHVIGAPPAGVVGLEANPDFCAKTVRFETTDLVTPRTVFSYDPATKTARALWSEPAPGHDPGLYRTERRWFTSRDGTRVPLTLAWRADRPAGPGPALLYGYGAYEHSSDPAYRADRPVLPLLDRGVLYAVAHVRGGGELGRHWYLDGKLQHKHHSFEDFVAAGRYLVDEGLTSPAQLAAMGRSAGGLLVGASVNLAPDLFAAVVAEVPFVDCLTTMLDATLPLTVTEHEEWGDPEADEAAYEWIKAYSPYDNVQPVPYPRMFVSAGLNDPRVGYFEPAKWVQKLRAAHHGNRRRVLLQVELAAGHRGSSGRYQVWKQRAGLLAFVLEATGATRPAEAGTADTAAGAAKVADEARAGRLGLAPQPQAEAVAVVKDKS